MNFAHRKLNTPTVTFTAGFTLIEIMIVVAIVGILAAIGYPNYTAYVERGKRSEGRAELVKLAARLERGYSDNNQYTDNIASPVVTENGYYSVALVLPGSGNQTFSLTANPQAPWTDGLCGNLTYDQTGARGSSVADALVDPAKTTLATRCWGK